MPVNSSNWGYDKYKSAWQAILAAWQFLNSDCLWPPADVPWWGMPSGTVSTVATNSGGGVTLAVTNGDGTPFTVNATPECYNVYTQTTNPIEVEWDMIIWVDPSKPETAFRITECSLVGVDVPSSDPSYTGNITGPDRLIMNGIVSKYIDSLPNLEGAMFFLLPIRALFTTDRLLDRPNDEERWVGNVSSDIFSTLGATDGSGNGYLQSTGSADGVIPKANWNTNYYRMDDLLAFDTGGYLHRFTIESNTSDTTFFGSTTQNEITETVVVTVGLTVASGDSYTFILLKPDDSTVITNITYTADSSDSARTIAVQFTDDLISDANAPDWVHISNGGDNTFTLTRYPCDTNTKIYVTTTSSGGSFTHSITGPTFNPSIRLSGIFDIGTSGFVATPGGISSQIPLWSTQAKPTSLFPWYTGTTNYVPSTNLDRTVGGALYPLSEGNANYQYNNATPPACDQPVYVFDHDLAYDINGDSCGCSGTNSGRHANPWLFCGIRGFQDILCSLAGQAYDPGWLGGSRTIQQYGIAGVLYSINSSHITYGYKISVTATADGVGDISGYGGPDGPVFVSLASTTDLTSQGNVVSNLTDDGSGQTLLATVSSGVLNCGLIAAGTNYTGWAAAGFRRQQTLRIRQPFYGKQIWVADLNIASPIDPATLVNFSMDGSLGVGQWTYFDLSTQYQSIDAYGTISENGGTPVGGQYAIYVTDNTCDGLGFPGSAYTFDEQYLPDAQQPYLSRFRRGKFDLVQQQTIEAQMAGQAVYITPYSIRDLNKQFTKDKINNGVVRYQGGIASAGSDTSITVTGATTGAMACWYNRYSNIGQWQNFTAEISAGGFATGTVTVGTDGTATVSAMSSCFTVTNTGTTGTKFGLVLNMPDGSGVALGTAEYVTVSGDTVDTIAAGLSEAWTTDPFVLFASSTVSGAVITLTGFQVLAEPFFVTAHATGSGAISLTAGGPSPCTAHHKVLVTGGSGGVLTFANCGFTVNSNDGLLIREPQYEVAKFSLRSLSTFPTPSSSTDVKQKLVILGHDDDTIFVAPGSFDSGLVESTNTGNVHLSYQVLEVPTGIVLQYDEESGGGGKWVVPDPPVTTPTIIEAWGLHGMWDLFGDWIWDDITAVANGITRTLGSGGFSGVIPAGTPYVAFDSSGPEPYDEGVTNCTTEWPYMWNNFWIPHFIVLSSDGTDVGSPGMEIDYSFQPNPSDGYVCGGANDECSFEAEGVAGVGVFIPTSTACPNVAVSLTPWILTGLPPGGGSPYVPTYNAPSPFIQNQYVDIGTVGAYGGQNGPPIGPVGTLDYLIEMSMPPYIPGCNTFISLGYGVDDIVVVVDR